MDAGIPLVGPAPTFKVGDRVKLYSFQGTVVSVFWKRNGERRFVVEDANGDCYLTNADSIAKVYADSFHSGRAKHGSISHGL